MTMISKWSGANVFKAGMVSDWHAREDMGPAFGDLSGEEQFTEFGIDENVLICAQRLLKISLR